MYIVLRGLFYTPINFLLWHHPVNSSGYSRWADCSAQEWYWTTQIPCRASSHQYKSNRHHRLEKCFSKEIIVDSRYLSFICREDLAISISLVHCRWSWQLACIKITFRRQSSFTCSCMHTRDTIKNATTRCIKFYVHYAMISSLNVKGLDNTLDMYFW